MDRSSFDSASTTFSKVFVGVMRLGELRTYTHSFKERHPPFALKFRSFVGLDCGRSTTFGDQLGECRRTLRSPTHKINNVQSGKFVGNQILTSASLRGWDRQEKRVHIAHVIHSSNFQLRELRLNVIPHNLAAFRFDGRDKLRRCIQSTSDDVIGHKSQCLLPQ